MKPGFAVFFRSIGLIVLGSFFIPLASFAGGTVSTANESSLRSALAGGGMVTFAVDGSIALSSPLVISNDTILDGSGHSVIISGNNLVRVFEVVASVNFRLINCTIANGRTNSGAGLSNFGGTVILADCTFTNNQAIGATGSGGQFPGPGQAATGGAVYNSGQIIVSNAVFTCNTAAGGTGGSPTGVPEGAGSVGGDGSGGAIYNLGTLTLTNTVFVSNAAYGGSGGNAAGNFAPGGGGGAYGGAIWSVNGSIQASNCRLGGNLASAGVAGFSISGRAAPYRGAARGGAICNQTGGVIFATSIITNNSAAGSPASGGGIYHGSAALTLSNVLLAQNSVYADRVTLGIASLGSSGIGGGVCNAGAATFADCTISSNTVLGGAGVAGAGGGPSYGGDCKGAGVYNSGSIDLTRSALVGNTGTGGAGGSGAPGGTAYGGGFMTEGPAGWMLNCTVAVNRVTGGLGSGAYGGGICNNMALTNCTLSGNTADTAGGNLASLGNPSSSINTIFSTGLPNNNSGGIIDFGHNISSDSSASFGGPSSLNNTDPGLGPLGNYGGLSPTMPLKAGSPALDSADNSAAPSSDQRGRARPFGAGSDIGAFESSPPYVVMGRFFGLNLSDSIAVSLEGLVLDVASGGSFRYDNIAAGSHEITSSNPQLIVAPAARTLLIGPDVFDANFFGYQWNTVNLASRSNGVAQIIYGGTNGQLHRLLTSSNLVSWFPIATNSVNSANYYEVFDAGSIGQPLRFYRSVSP